MSIVKGTGPQPLRVRGVGRMADEPRALLVCLTDVPSDHELRSFHDFVEGWTPLGASNAIDALAAEVELYRSRWLSCVTPEEARRLRDALETVRSLLRGLPRTATADSIDQVCANALGAA